jgi:enamine deaminase RidA (YjgF/YER057c/UK114 family)
VRRAQVIASSPTSWSAERRAAALNVASRRVLAKEVWHDGAVLDGRLMELGLVLPEPPRMPVGVATAFSWVRVVGDRVLVSGHGPQSLDGSPAGPFGRVPTDVSLEQATKSARLAALSVLSSIRAAIGDLDLVTAWVSVTGFVQADPGYAQTTAVVNGFSELILDVFGDEVGRHARTAIGVAALPLNLPVVVAAEVQRRTP